MTLHFSGSKKPTLGFEIELQLIDPVSLDLTPRAQEVLARCSEHHLSHVKAEIHQSMLEIDTMVSKDVKECRQNLLCTFSSLYQIADEVGVGISISGTHPFQKWPERRIYPQPRYLEIQKKFRWLARRMDVYGLHVHVGVPTSEEVLFLMNTLVQFLPHLIALSANSPFWHGRNTGMLACRPNILESFPTGGVPPYFENWERLEEYVAFMEQAKALCSFKDLYWYLRPNLEFGTIEFRIADAVSTLDEMMALTACIQCLVELVRKEPERWKRDSKMHWVAAENNWIAERDGLQGLITVDAHGTKRAISEELFELLEQLVPISHALNNYEELLYIEEILKRGSGAVRQKQIFTETDSLYAVVKDTSERLRQSIDPVWHEKITECAGF